MWLFMSPRMTKCVVCILCIFVFFWLFRPQYTARLMWQKWFLVVGFPKHEPIFFFKLFPTFSVRIAYKNPRANKFR